MERICLHLRFNLNECLDLLALRKRTVTHWTDIIIKVAVLLLSVIDAQCSWMSDLTSGDFLLFLFTAEATCLTWPKKVNDWILPPYILHAPLHNITQRPYPNYILCIAVLTSRKKEDERIYCCVSHHYKYGADNDPHVTHSFLSQHNLTLTCHDKRIWIWWFGIRWMVQINTC